MLREVIHFLQLSPGLSVIDGTVGAGGHSQHIHSKIQPDGTLIGLDRDPMMLKHARATVGDSSSIHLIHSSYQQSRDVLDQLGINRVDRVLVDLGLSSDQLADDQRGFGFQAGGELDMRFDTSTGMPAWELLQHSNQKQIADMLKQFGEEKFSDAIAAEIVRRSKRNPIRTTDDLVEAVEAAIPGKAKSDSRKHPATRVFQALRIAANQELEHLQTFLNQTLPDVLAPGGRVVVLTFHSLEDRLVKQSFRDSSQWENITPKPVTAATAETRLNPRSRTAKLRAAVKAN